MEFRNELKRYSNPLDGKPILPIQVPPLVPSHLLRPTSTNKMYNTRIEFKNFARASREHAVAPVAHEDIVFNQQQLATLIAGDLETGTLFVTNAKGTFAQPARRKAVGAAAMLDFLKSYSWAGGNDTVLQRETEILTSEKEGFPEWLFLNFEGPQRSKYCRIGDRQFRVYNRSRTDERFNVYSESAHHPIVKYLCGVEEAEPDNDTTRGLRKASRAALVFYPAADIEYRDDPIPPAVAPGFALQFPDNSNPMQIRFTVLVKSREHEPIMDAAAADLQGKARAAKGQLARKKAARTAGKGK
jgi:hypothetical protein